MHWVLRSRRGLRSLVVLFALAAGSTGCTSLLGDFSSGPGGDGGSTSDATADQEAEEGGGDATMDSTSMAEGGPESSVADAGPDVAVDAPQDAPHDAPHDAPRDAPVETGPSCGPTTCPMGCCDTNGTCVPYTSQSSTECGNAGAACGGCAAGDSCSSGACTCGGAACTGCCSSTGSCVTSSNAQCGSNGTACIACPTGQECVSGACVCDATSCPTGCCTASGACEPIGLQNDMSCGTGGAACATCPGGESCNGTGQCECTSGSCPGGCCTASLGGTCVPYVNETSSQCGASGAICSACSNGLCDTTNGICKCDANTCPTGCCTSSGACEAYGSQSTSSCGTAGASCAACGPASGGSVTCASGACECNGGAGCASGATCCSAGCANLQTDPNNCGACGHSCLGGSCSGGQCQPVVLANLGSANGEAITVGPSYVYFTDSTHHVSKCPVAGCSGGTPTVIYTGSGSGFFGGIDFDPNFMALDVSDESNSAILEMSTSGTLNWTNSGNGVLQPIGLTGDPNEAYWAQYNGIAYADKAGSATTQLCTFTFNQNFQRVIFDPAVNAVFAAVRGSSGGRIVQCPAAGFTGSPTVFGPLEPDAYDIAYALNHIYYVIAGTPPNYSDGGLWVSSDTALTNRTALAQGAAYGNAEALTVDLTNAYFASGASNKIYKCALAGCGGAPTPIATTTGTVRGLANDASAIYWTGTSNTVMRLAK